MKVPTRVGVRKTYIAAVVAAIMFVAAALYGGVRLQADPPVPQLTIDTPHLELPAPRDLAWPSYGQAAVGTAQYGVLATHGNDQPQATASTAKLITALAVMRQKPFNDRRGATITFSAADAASYQRYLAGNGTVTPVYAGLQWTQYQALQAILLESANNVSDTMAVWAFGSLVNYRDYAQAMVEELGMTQTTIGVDASGYDASTTSTAHDLVLLARAVLAEPMLREIAAQAQATLPGVGTIDNTNRLLVHDDVTGLKTGWIPQAGGVFVLTGIQQEGGQLHEIITVVMGQPGGPGRMAQDDAYRLFQSAKNNFSYQQIVREGEQVGRYDTAWQGEVRVTAGRALGMFVWAGDRPEIISNIPDRPTYGQVEAGELTVQYGLWQQKVPLQLSAPANPPSLWWKLTH